MTAVFRVDASSAIGSGHFMRCLALADALSRRGVETMFVSRAHPGHLLNLLYRRAMRVAVLAAADVSHTGFADVYASWLGAPIEEDAAQTIAALEGGVAEWLIVDHYAIGSEWERLLRPHVRGLMAIDDLANRAHDCDLLLDHNFSPAGSARYRGLVPDSCRLLTGPQYALLGPEYSEFRRTRHARNGRARRVFVFFGGTDPNDMTGLALEALCAPELRHLQVDIVVGASYSYREKLERRARERPRTTILGPRAHLADLMAEADLAIGAGGTTTWERMCLGVPSVVISTADNQRPACRALAEAGRISYAGHSDDVDTNSLAKLVRSLADSAEELRRLGAANEPLVDGHGALRAAEALYPSEWARVRVRPSSGMERRDHLQFTFETDGLPLGELRLARAEDDALVDFDMDPITLGRGWEAQAVGAATSLVRRCRAALSGGSDRLPYLRSANARAGTVPDSTAMYSIQVLSDAESWMNESIPRLLADWLDAGHRVLWIHDRRDLQPGDFSFLLGCGQIVPRDARTRLRHCLVVHESDLPRGKGWSPLTWQILEGANRIPVSLIEAADKVDSGRIYAQHLLEFQGHELVDELRAAVARAALELCRRFVAEYPRSARDGREQAGAETFYPRRTAKDSRIDTSATIDAQFNLLRVVDNARYPANFEHHGFRYELQVRKARSS